MKGMEKKREELKVGGGKEKESWEVGKPIKAENQCTKREKTNHLRT